jgi:hypothetical protein
MATDTSEYMYTALHVFYIAVYMSTSSTKRKEHYCACSRFCKRKKIVSLSTFNRHQPYRDADYREDYLNRMSGLSGHSTRLPSIGGSMRGRRNIIFILSFFLFIFEVRQLRAKQRPVVALPIPASVEGEPSAAQSPGANTGRLGRSLPGNVV